MLLSTTVALVVPGVLLCFFFFYKEYWSHLLFLFNIEISELPDYDNVT